jgi:hypothetical protein
MSGYGYVRAIGGAGRGALSVLGMLWVLAGGVSMAGAQEGPALPPTVAGEVIRTVTADQLAAFMRQEGYATEVDEDGDVLWKIDGFQILPVRCRRR